jgi:hypothetical protein
MLTVSPKSTRVFVFSAPVMSAEENSSPTRVWKSNLLSANALATRMNSGSSSEQPSELA